MRRLPIKKFFLLVLWKTCLSGKHCTLPQSYLCGRSFWGKAISQTLLSPEDIIINKSTIVYCIYIVSLHSRYFYNTFSLFFKVYLLQIFYQFLCHFSAWILFPKNRGACHKNGVVHEECNATCIQQVITGYIFSKRFRTHIHSFPLTNNTKTRKYCLYIHV
jgi:hypothetical protein